MKRWMILMGWIIMGFTAFSQTLKPTVLTVNLDTNFCFTIPQSKIIAEYIIKGQFADTLESQYNKEVKLHEAKAENDLLIQAKLQQTILHLDTIVGNNEASMLILKNQIELKDKRLKRAKWQKIALGTAWVLTAFAIILK